MKILILSFYFQPDLCAGSFRCTSLVDELMKQLGPDDSVELVTTLPNRYASFSQEALEHETRGALTIHRLQLPSHSSGMLDQVKAFYTYYTETIKLLKGKEFDLVFATSSRLFTGFLGAQVARHKKAKLYLDIRDIFVDTLTDILSKRVTLLLYPILKLIESYTFKSATRLNMVSEGFKGYLSRFQPDSNFDYFTNGVDEEFIHEITPRKIEKPFHVLYAGNIGEGQGLSSIVPEICSQMDQEIHFTILGDGGRKDVLIAELESRNLQNYTLLDPVSREELIAHYDSADILFLHLNYHEAFEKVLPSKLFEYAAMGKPIWAGVGGYAAQFIKQNISNAVVFQSGNAEDAIDQFKQLSLEVESREEFISKFRRTHIMKEMVQSILKTGR